MVEETARHFGRIDLLVNCAGASARCAFNWGSRIRSPDGFESNRSSAAPCAALPSLLESKGHVVNIGSLASKSAGPYLGAYPTTKFAVAAYSQQLRLELGPEGLHVLLVCPGPIRRDELGDYGANTMQSLPASAAKPGGGVKVGRIDPDWLGREGF